MQYHTYYPYNYARNIDKKENKITKRGKEREVWYHGVTYLIKKQECPLRFHGIFSNDWFFFLRDLGMNNLEGVQGSGYKNIIYINSKLCSLFGHSRAIGASSDPPQGRLPSGLPAQ